MRKAGFRKQGRKAFEERRSGGQYRYGLSSLTGTCIKHDVVNSLNRHTSRLSKMERGKRDGANSLATSLGEQRRARIEERKRVREGENLRSEKSPSKVNA
jgi:hypothetical protein